MRWGVLGPVEVTGPSGPVDLGTPLQRALLALLLVEPGSIVPVDRLVEEVWAGTPPARPLSSLQAYVANLRRAVEPGRAAGAAAEVLRTEPGGYRLAVDPGEVDATAFLDRATQVGTLLAEGNATDALATADAGLALWRGNPLPEVADRDRVRPVVARLTAVRTACQEDRLAALLAVGPAGRAVAELEAFVDAEPLRERAWLLLLAALQAAGRTADALDRYRQVRAVLGDELGLDPGEALVQAEAALLRGEPVPAGVPAAPVRLAARPSASLLGRDQEVSALQDVLAGLPTAGCRVVLVEGEPGIGKSALARHVLDEAGAAGLRTAWGRCHDDPDTPPLWPWRQVLDGLGQHVPAVTDGVDRQPFALFEEIGRALTTAAATAPVAVVLDDMQWADPTTARLLAFLAVELDRSPVAVIATARPTPRPGSLAQALATIVRQRGYLHLPLQPLLVQATARLASQVAEDLEEAAVQLVVTRSGGNPFFAVELARLLAAGETGAGTAVPAGVRAVVEQRLRELDPAATEVLRTAAVLGEQIGIRALVAVHDAPTVEAGIQAALDGHLLRSGWGGSYAFVHALVRETILAGLPDLQRRRLHAALAQVRTSPFERAHHLVEASPLADPHDVVAATLAAARDCESPEAAVRWFERALEVIEGEPGVVAPEERLQVLREACRALVAAEEDGTAHRRLEELLGLAAVAGDEEALGEAAALVARTGGTWFWTPYSTVQDGLVTGLRRAREVVGRQDSPALVRVTSTLASGLQYGPSADEGPVLAAQAVAVAERLGQPDLLADALSAQVHTLWRPDRIPEQRAAVDRLVELAGAEGLEDRRLVAHTLRAVFRMEDGDVRGSDADAAVAWSLAERGRAVTVQAQLTWMRSARAALAGDFEEAVRLAGRGQVLHERTQQYTAEIQLGLRQIGNRRLQRTMGELEPAALALAASEPDGRWEWHAATLVGRGDLERARRLLDRGGVGQAPRWWDWLWFTCFQAELVADVGATSHAPRLIELLRPEAERFVIMGTIDMGGPVALFLGRLEALVGDPGATARLRQALDVADEHGLRPIRVHALRELAALEPDRRAAQALRTTAEAEARALGIGPDPVRRRTRGALTR